MSNRRVKRRRADLDSSSSSPRGRSRRSDAKKDVGDREKARAERKFVWTHYPDCGFPNRVNHAVASLVTSAGEKYAFSVGGYHADDDERTVLQADTLGGPYFRSGPIDVHCLDVDARSWDRIAPPPADKYIATNLYPTTKIPGCRYGHTVCSYNNKIYMFGGRNDEDGSFAVVECYDILLGVWLRIPTAGILPTSRDGHACATIGEDMFIHGGFAATERRFSGDLFRFNMVSHTWYLLPNEGAKVIERDFHTATAIKNDIFVFGGRSDRFAPFFTANDVYENHFFAYNIDEQKWKAVNTTGYVVHGRRSHAAVGFDKNIVYFGGYNAVEKEHYGDIFILNTETCHVTEIQPFGDAPCSRRRVGATLIGSELIICGGTSPQEVSRDGSKKTILHDHCDMFTLNFLPTLEQLCMMSVINKGIDFSPLPTLLRMKIDCFQGKHTQIASPVVQGSG